MTQGQSAFFARKAIGIFVEDAAQLILQRGPSNRERRDGARNEHMEGQWSGVLRREIGHIWVFAFMVWTTPVWVYPSLIQNTGEEKDVVVPFSIIGAIVRRP